MSKSVVFAGTFDPMHGAHVGQLLRAHTYMPFSKAYILIDKHPLHKPNATEWAHRLKMVEMTLASVDLPFEYEVILVDDTLAPGIKDSQADYKVTGIDSLIENLSTPKYFSLAQRWPMIVMSIPGMQENELNSKLLTIPQNVRAKIHHVYVNEDEVPIMNYDFESKLYSGQRVHSTYVRSGERTSFLPKNVSEYIKENHLYVS